VTPVPLAATTAIKPGDSQASATLELEPRDRQKCAPSEGASINSMVIAREQE